MTADYSRFAFEAFKGHPRASPLIYIVVTDLTRIIFSLSLFVLQGSMGLPYTDEAKLNKSSLIITD